jgi:transcriptional regulator
MKKREIEYKTFNKIENAKNHPFFLEKIKSRAEVKTSEGRRLREERKENGDI